VVRAEAKVDANTSFGNMMEVEIKLGCERCTLSVCVLDEAQCSKRKEAFGRVRVEGRRGLVKEDVRVGGMMEGRSGRELDAVRTVSLEEKNEFGGQELWQRLENRDSFLVDRLNPSFNLVAMSGVVLVIRALRRPRDVARDWQIASESEQKLVTRCPRALYDAMSCSKQSIMS